MIRRRPARPHPPPPTIFRWDLDKTYLKTDFDRLRDLVRIPFEGPEDKRTVPGVAPLIRGLRDAGTQAGRTVGIYFISASPPQIAKAIEGKLALDGIRYDGIQYKDQLKNLVRGKFRNLREQVGYKLTKLLEWRARVDPEAREVLFGDDWESDPLIYSMYADTLAGRLSPVTLGGLLRQIGVDPELVDEATARAAATKPAEIVARIFINLERRTPPSNFRRFGPRLVPTFNYFQTAACLYQDECLNLPSVALVTQQLIEDFGYSPARLGNLLADIERRGHLRRPGAIAVREYLAARSLLQRSTADREPEGWLDRIPLLKGFADRLRAWRRPEAPADEAFDVDYQGAIAESRPIPTPKAG